MSATGGPAVYQTPSAQPSDAPLKNTSELLGSRDQQACDNRCDQQRNDLNEHWLNASHATRA
jgi:hypothetical protein